MWGVFDRRSLGDLSSTALDTSMATTLFHWTLHPWAMYAAVRAAQPTGEAVKLGDRRYDGDFRLEVRPTNVPEQRSERSDTNAHP
jgi:hypothetical protein